MLNYILNYIPELNVNVLIFTPLFLIIGMGVLAAFILMNDFCEQVIIRGSK